MNKEGLKYVLAQFTARELPETRPRDLKLPLTSEKVVGLVGVRRSGKTFLMYETIKRLVREGVSREQIIYLNFEDDRLYPIDSGELDLILTAHGELYPDTQSLPRYLFFDEVQNVAGWERYVRRLIDTERVHIFVTGSSSGVLGRDLATAMRGRTLRFEVFPLSFAEYVRFKDLSYRPYDRRSEARMVHALEEYLCWGGLPELVLADKPMKPLIIEEYSDLLFFRDLIERHSVRNERLMRLLLKYCASRPAHLMSVHRLHRDFRSQGLKVSKNTLYEYLGYLQDSLILFTVPKHEASINKQEQNPRKIHLIDVALVRAFSVFPDRYLGHKLENVVFLHERRRGKNIFYYSNAHEVDLYHDHPEGARFLNVTWSLSDQATRFREEKAMAFAADHYGHASGYLVVHETGPNGSDWPVTPAWDYLLNGRS